MGIKMPERKERYLKTVCLTANNESNLAENMDRWFGQEEEEGFHLSIQDITYFDGKDAHEHYIKRVIIVYREIDINYKKA